MPPRLIISIIMSITALVLGFFLVWPKYQYFQQRQTEVEQKEIELSSKTEYYSKFREIWGRLEKYQDSLSRVDEAIPETYSLPALFYYLQQTAGQAGLVVEGIIFNGVSGEEIKEISVSVQASGRYSSLQDFLSALENSVRFFNVKSISFSSPGEEEIFSFDLGIATYSY